MNKAKKKSVSKKQPTKKIVPPKKSIPLKKEEPKKVVQKIVIHCKLKQCLNFEDGICSTDIPTILKAVKPDTIKCPFFDEDFKKTYNEFKKAGGVLGVVLKGKGKLTEEEVNEEKKAKRKARAESKKKS